MMYRDKVPRKSFSDHYFVMIGIREEIGIRILLEVN